MNQKLVVLVRQDLLPGQQAVQGGHAAINFIFEHPEIAKPWFVESNYLVYLGVENEEMLKLYIDKCNERGLKYTEFIEPDLNDSTTAIAIEPSDNTRKLVSNLPLLFKKAKQIY